MSDTCPVVTIQTPAGPTRINESDFDPAKHVRCDEGGVALDKTSNATTTAATVDDRPCLQCGALEGELHRARCSFATNEYLNGCTVFDLRAMAAAAEIDLGDATKKADIIAAIEAAKS